MNVIHPVTKPLPVGSADYRASGWWGMWCLIATEASLFAYLLFGYFYLGSQAHGHWVWERPKLVLALPNTFILIASSFVLHWGETGIRSGRQDRLVRGLGGAIVLGAVFVGMQVLEWHNKPFALSTNAYASSYFVTTGFHLAHVIGGLLVLGVLLFWTTLGLFNAKRHVAVSIGSLYWHFVDVVWLAVFTTFYLLPYLR